jgi:hypothetical protein
VGAAELEADGWLALLQRHPKEARGEKEASSTGGGEENSSFENEHDTGMSEEKQAGQPAVLLPRGMSLRDLVTSGGGGVSVVVPLTVPGSFPSPWTLVSGPTSSSVPAASSAPSENPSAPLSDTEGSLASPADKVTTTTTTTTSTNVRTPLTLGIFLNFVART